MRGGEGGEGGGVVEERMIFCMGCICVFDGEMVGCSIQKDNI